MCVFQPHVFPWWWGRSWRLKKRASDLFQALSFKVFGLLGSIRGHFTCSASSQGLCHNSPAVPGTVGISHSSALTQTRSHQQQRKDAAIHNSCLVLFKASRHEKRGEWKGYASLDGNLRAKEEMEPVLSGRLFIIGVIYILYPLSLCVNSLNILNGKRFCCFSTILSGMPLNLCPAFVTLIRF